MFTLLALLGAGCAGWLIHKNVKTETTQQIEVKELTPSGWNPDGVTNENEYWVKLNITAIILTYKKVVGWFRKKQTT